MDGRRAHEMVDTKMVVQDIPQELQGIAASIRLHPSQVGDAVSGI